MNIIGHRKVFLFLLLFSIANRFVYAQSSGTKKIEVKNADGLYFDEEVGNGAKRLIGNVIFFHEGSTMYCDSAYLYDAINSLDAYGHVHIHNTDSVNAYGDFLKYDGNNKVAELKNNVRLTDNDMVLTTNALLFNTKDNIAQYTDNGKVVNKQNTLTSKYGYYYTKTNDLYFKKNVILVNKDYTVDTDTMKYNTTSKVSYFFGPTTIKSDDNLIYCENGWYDTNKNKAQFSKRAWLRNKEQGLKGDSIVYDRNLGIGKGFKNVEIIDSTQKITVYGDYGEYYEKQSKSLVTGKALLAQKMDEDTLFLHADTLKAVYDTINKNQKTIWAYHKVKFYKKDMQGKCDSLVYSFGDSLIKMFVKPVLWNEDKQLTAEFIQIKTYDGIIEKLHLKNSAFIIAEKDSDKYDQIKGKTMNGIFVNNKLHKIFVNGNGQTVYYAKEDKKESWIGANKADCSDMVVYITDNELKKITFLKKPTATLYPLKDVIPAEFQLKDFNWRVTERPKDRYELLKD